MPKYVIERPLPGAAKLSADELRGIAAKSNEVLKELGPDLQWIQTFVTTDKLYCVYVAKNPELVREHARCGGFPCDVVAQVKTAIDPTTGEER